MRNAVLALIALAVFLPAKATDDIRFKMSPNPATTQVTIHPEFNATDVRVEMFTVIGNKVLDQAFFLNETNEGITINVSRIPEGIYLVRVSSGNHSAVKRLRVEHS